jgi:D-glycero-D-manno-heptose 1,7-bisphosphate phosphatase
MKLLILDKDGTLVQPVSGEKFVQHPHDQKFIPGVSEAIARYVADGWKVAIASNQAGVAAGYKTLKDAIAEMEYCLALTLGKIKHGFLCPDMEGKQCYRVISDEDYTWHCDRKALHNRIIPVLYNLDSYRKPGYGMLQEAASNFGMMNWKGFRDPSSILFVGDRPEDEQAALNAGVRFMWVSEWRGDAT